MRLNAQRQREFRIDTLKVLIFIFIIQYGLEFELVTSMQMLQNQIYTKKIYIYWHDAFFYFLNVRFLLIVL